ncbi:MAG: hypothetical protein IPK73_10280 [Candidatus Obscuribacter sp.]|nr:hypothetical protein [Candidatus Obscuribacter sp.]
MSIEPGSAADWAAALTNTVVLLFIYRQLKLMNVQMIQNDEQERFRRSLEFIKLYKEQLEQTDSLLPCELLNGDFLEKEPSGEDFPKLLELFYRPRVRLFTLLNLLMEHQEVEERLLFNYLIDEFNNFLAIGVKADGSAAFMQGTGARLSILLTAWGSQVKARKLLFPVG